MRDFDLKMRFFLNNFAKKRVKGLGSFLKLLNKNSKLIPRDCIFPMAIALAT